MYEFWYDYVKPKYGKKAKLCYMETDSFIVYIKTDDIYQDIAEDVETRFDTSNYESECNSTERPLPKRRNLIKFVGLRAKTYSYLKDDSSEDKKSKRHKKVCHKKKT